MYNNYEKTRFVKDKKREVVWKEIIRYLKDYFPKNGSVLDLGSGYCQFINNVPSRNRFALDKYLDPKRFAGKNVVPLFGDSSLIKKKVVDNSLDLVFASNFVEHLEFKELEKYMVVILSKLKPNGKLILLQPNYRLSYKEYFDDYTHIKEWSDVGIKDYLESKGFVISLSIPGFLPFSMKSKLPISRFLIWFYLRSPIKPFAKQMLIIAKKK